MNISPLENPSQIGPNEEELQEESL